MNLPEALSETCPKCQAKMRKRKSSNGPFWSCSRYPDCTGARAISKPIAKRTSRSSNKTGGSRKPKP
ncbi:topoisomerase DNA-binding C4 zinc finger domain-containing protein [Salinicola sp. 4072]|uniref:topoisomerase DNA-binding C4 zinc finger domain-containing protein n=1 Tax=Salinicola sp. 4072 TaxID=3082157 RepID=UPI002FCC4CFA